MPSDDTVELVRNSGLSESALFAVGTDHRLADPEPLAKMLEAIDGKGTGTMSSLPPYTLPHDRMPEAEVALRLAFHLLTLPGASKTVTVCLDDQHVTSGGHTIFPLTPFLDAENWKLIEQQGKQRWHGIYRRDDQEMVLSPDSRGGDVIMQLGGRRIRAECKKGPLEKRKGNPENQLLHDAIGQLMTIEKVDASDLLVIAVPATEQFRKRLAWQDRPLMTRTGIHIVLVGRDGIVEGLEILLFGKDA